MFNLEKLVFQNICCQCFDIVGQAVDVINEVEIVDNQYKDDDCKGLEDIDVCKVIYFKQFVEVFEVYVIL